MALLIINDLYKMYTVKIIEIVVTRTLTRFEALEKVFLNRL